mgnify:FL=1
MEVWIANVHLAYFYALEPIWVGALRSAVVTLLRESDFSSRSRLRMYVPVPRSTRRRLQASLLSCLVCCRMERVLGVTSVCVGVYAKEEVCVVVVTRCVAWRGRGVVCVATSFATIE